MKKIVNFSRFIPIFMGFVIAISLNACSSSGGGGSPSNQNNGNNPPPFSSLACANKAGRLAAGKGYCFEAQLVTRHDGTTIDMTVFVPHPDRLASAAGLPNGSVGFAPLILHSHGYGGKKVDDFSTPEFYVDEQAAEKAWDNGYFVITFSERGFGKSTGAIALMNPEKEGQDINEVVDWAITHLRDGIYNWNFNAATATHTNPTAIPADLSSTVSLLMGDNQARLPNTPNPDPALGSVGYSYGGGYQYTGSHADTIMVGARTPRTRFDALVPEGTWFDLRYSLHSQDVPKTAWLTILTAFTFQGSNCANGANQGCQPPPPILIQARTEADALGRTSSSTQNVLRDHSPIDYCDSVTGTTTPVSIFHIQGYRDTLFNFLDGYYNALCSEKAGNDTRLLMGIGGHPLPALTPQNYTGHDSSMDIDEVVHCGVDGAGNPKRLYVRDMIFAFFEEKLRGQIGAANIIPKVCMVQENTDINDELMDANFHPGTGTPPMGRGNAFKYAKEGVTLPRVQDILVGAGASPNYTCTNAVDGARCTFTLSNFTYGPYPIASTANFVPLVNITQARVMAGIPSAKFTFTGLGGVAPVVGDPIFFVGTAVRRNGAVMLIHDQYTALRSTAGFPFTDANGNTDKNGQPLHYGCAPNEGGVTPCMRGRLTGISVRLLPGDEVGLAFYGSAQQFAVHGARTIGALNISGDVEFPIYAPSALPVSVN